MTKWISKEIIKRATNGFFMAKRRADLSRQEDRNETISQAVEVTVKQYGRALQKLTNE